MKNEDLIGRVLTPFPRADEPQYKLLLTVDEAARTLSIGRSLVYMLINRRLLASVKIGAARRIPRHALEDYVRSLARLEQAG